MPTARKLRINPANFDQAYVLWSNGYIETKGSAVLIVQEDDPGQPPIFTFDIARDFVITDWTTPSGYVMDGWGGIHNFGNALPADNAGLRAPPYFPNNDIARVLIMDPAANGAGYLWDGNGGFHYFGGAASIASGNGVWSGDLMRDVELNWSDKKHYKLDLYGGVHPNNGAAAVTNSFYQQFDIARTLQYNWTLGKGYILDGWGGIHPINGAEDAFGGPYWAGWDIARDLQVLQWGNDGNPLEMAVLDGLGVIHRFISSTPPTVDVTAPSATVTNTTRPLITWTYTDAQGDAQTEYQAKLFTAAQYGAGGFDPETSAPTWSTTGTDPATRGVTPTIDLVDNTTYRAYVKVKDSSGQYSTWDYIQFLVDITPPPTPNLAVTVQAGSMRNYLEVTGAGTDASYRVEIQYSDDDGVTWATVRDALALDPDAFSNVSTYDREMPFNKARKYRARTYVPDPVLNGAWSTVQTATFSYAQWRLMDPLEPSLALDVQVREPFGFTRHRSAGVFQPIGASRAIVVKGDRYGADARLMFWLLDETTYSTLDSLMRIDRTLLLRDPMGRSWYIAVVDDETWTMLRAVKQSGEAYPVRHAHTLDLRVVEVARP